MKQITLTICVAIFMFSCNDSTKTEEKKTGGDTITKVDDKPAPPPPQMDSASMMKAMIAYGTPGPVQAMLAKSNGTWDEEVTMYVPGKPPAKNTSTAENTMILGGRYQQSIHKGSFNGMPFEGISTLGFDNAKKKFVSSWVDNMGTGITYMEGTWDSTAHTVTSKGKMVDPASGNDLDIRQVFTLVDDNHQKLEMYATQNGKETKSMEINLKRK